jgi:hypothetical protein
MKQKCNIFGLPFSPLQARFFFGAGAPAGRIPAWAFGRFYGMMQGAGGSPPGG